MGVDIRVNLKGPNNYRVWGTARVEICKVGIEIDFDKEFGTKKPEIPQTVKSPLEALKAEMDNPKNWKVEELDVGFNKFLFRNDIEEDLVDRRPQRVESLELGFGLAVSLDNTNRVLGADRPLWSQLLSPLTRVDVAPVGSHGT